MTCDVQATPHDREVQPPKNTAQYTLDVKRSTMAKGKGADNSTLQKSNIPKCQMWCSPVHNRSNHFSQKDMAPQLQYLQ